MDHPFLCTFHAPPHPNWFLLPYPIQRPMSAPSMVSIRCSSDMVVVLSPLHITLLFVTAQSDNLKTRVGAEARTQTSTLRAMAQRFSKNKKGFATLFPSRCHTSTYSDLRPSNSGGVDQGNSTRCHLSHVCQCYLQQGWPPSLNLAKGRTFRTEFYHSQHLTGSADLQTPVILMVISPFRGRRCFVVGLLLLKFSFFFANQKVKPYGGVWKRYPGTGYGFNGDSPGHSSIRRLFLGGSRLDVAFLI